MIRRSKLILFYLSKFSSIFDIPFYTKISTKAKCFSQVYVRWEPMLGMIYKMKDVCMCVAWYLLILIIHITYRTWVCLWQWEGHTLIQFKGSRVLPRCGVLVCKPFMCVVRHTSRIRECVSERTRLLQYVFNYIETFSYDLWITSCVQSYYHLLG